MAELGETMSSAEFSVWLEMYKQAPWDDTRGDVRAAIVAATVANYAGKVRKEGAGEAQVIDFIAFREREEIAEPDPMEFFGKLL